MKLAILSYHFPPEQVVAAIRPANWTEWLEEAFDVQIITRTIPGEKPVNSGKVLRPKSRCMDFLRALSARRKKSASSTPKKGNGTATTGSGVLTMRMPSLCDFWFFSAYQGLRLSRPDVILATHGPYVVLLVALVYRFFNPKTKIWADFRDLWSAHPRYPGWPLFRNLERTLEKVILRTADVITTVSQGLIEEFQTLEPKCSPKLIYNCVSPDIADSSSRISRLNDDVIRITYTGSLYSGWQDPAPLLKLIRKLHQDDIIHPKNLKLILASVNPGNFLELVVQEGLEDFLDFRGSLSRQECARIQQESDVLMIFESPGQQDKGFLTGKVFEYLYSSRPILLVGPTPETELFQLVEKYGRRMDLGGLEAGLREGKDSIHFQPGMPADSRNISHSQIMDAIQKLVN